MVDHLGDVMKCAIAYWFNLRKQLLGYIGFMICSHGLCGPGSDEKALTERYPSSISSSFAGTIPFSSMTTINPKRKIAMKTTALEKAQMNP